MNNSLDLENRDLADAASRACEPFVSYTSLSVIASAPLSVALVCKPLLGNDQAMQQPQLILLYHFFHPDEVISARLFSDLAEDMAHAGWKVTAMPAARHCHGDAPLPLSQQWGSVSIRRVWRPAFKQSSNVGRVLNAWSMLCLWTCRAMLFPRAASEAVIIGTDPVLAILVAIPWRLFRPRSRIVHWCHDLHPQASIADGVIKPTSWVIRILNWILRSAYRRCDAIVDLGPCMRALLQRDAGLPQRPMQRFETITPWALFEPANALEAQPEAKHELFGNCRLSCLYSGNLGRAHDFELFLKLARELSQDSISFCFAGRGPRMQQLKESLPTQQISNVHFAGFADEQQLHNRLAAGDVHLVSLRDNWTGTVVPSKFFGALAIGRPVLFVGSPNCSIARWIDELGVGWHLQTGNIAEVADELRQLANDEAARSALNRHCLEVYRMRFAKSEQLKAWSELLVD